MHGAQTAMKTIEIMLQDLVAGPLYETYWKEPRPPREQVLREVWGKYRWTEPVLAMGEIGIVAGQVLEEKR